MKEKDIVIDSCIITKYQAPIDQSHADLFTWLINDGLLAISPALMREYLQSGNPNVSILISQLKKHAEDPRIIEYSAKEIKEFKLDKNYKYTSNYKDKDHARLVFISARKKMVTLDDKLNNDINNFKKVDKVKPESTKFPRKTFYE